MELRVLQYFLAVTREQSISGAAEFLHLSQPTLSRQLKDLEDELGKQLFIRGNRRVTLTEEGMILRKLSNCSIEDKISRFSFKVLPTCLHQNNKYSLSYTHTLNQEMLYVVQT